MFNFLFPAVCMKINVHSSFVDNYQGIAEVLFSPELLLVTQISHLNLYFYKALKVPKE